MVVVLVIFMILNLVALVLQLIFGMHVRMNLGLCCRILNKRIDLNVSSNWKSCCFVYRFFGFRSYDCLGYFGVD